MKFLLTMAIVFASSFTHLQAESFRDGKGMMAWRAHEVRVNRAISAGIIGEVLGAKPTPELVKDTLGMGRIKNYSQLFTKIEEGQIQFDRRYDLVETLVKGEFHQGHFWEALWQVEKGHLGQYYPPGFERDRMGCEILVHIRYSEWTERGYSLNKTLKCVNGNRISPIEDERVTDWKTRGAQMSNKIWKDYPSFLTAGSPVLHVVSDGVSTTPNCYVQSGKDDIHIPNILQLCGEFFNGAAKIPIHLKIPL